MSYYWFNRQELLQKAKENMTMVAKKAAVCYRNNKNVIKQKAND